MGPRTLRWLLGASAALAGLAVVLALVLAWLAISRTPALSGLPTAHAEALRHVKQVLRPHDPRRTRPGRLYVLTLAPSDLALIVGHGARVIGGAAEVELGAGRLDLRASLPLPRNPFGRWLDLRLVLGDGDRLPAVRHLQLGQLPLPGWLAGPLLRAVLDRIDRADGELPPLHTMLKGVRLQPGYLQLVYEWRADSAQQMMARLMPPAQQARLRIYHEQLVALLADAPFVVDLPDLLQPMFALAQRRSAADGADPAAENRAALLTLAMYVGGRPVSRVLPDGAQWPRLRWRPVLLEGRWDFPQHLLMSAAVAAQAGGALADVLGLAKEVNDARDGSGFSFNDLAVNRAGSRLGELAVAAPERLQARLAAGVRADQLVPEVADLPEFLPEAEFLERFGGIGAPAYERLLAEIEARVEALPLVR